MKTLPKNLLLQAGRIKASIEHGKDALSDLVKEILAQTPEMEPSRFHTLASHLRELITSKRYQDPHEEFFRRAVTRDQSHISPKDYEECLSFVKTFEAWSGQLGRALEEAPTGRSDDGYHDLLDALPLAPQSLLQTLLANPEKFEDIEAAHPESIDLWKGELYNKMSLRKALATYLPTLEPPNPSKEISGKMRIKHLPAEDILSLEISSETGATSILHLHESDIFKALVEGKTIPITLLK